MSGYRQKGSSGYLFSIVLVAVIGGLLFGYDTAVISGAEKGLQAFFESAGDFTYTDSWHGFTSSSALIGCVIGAACTVAPCDSSAPVKYPTISTATVAPSVRMMVFFMVSPFV